MSKRNVKNESQGNNPIKESAQAIEIGEAQRKRSEKRKDSTSARTARRKKASLEHEVEESARKSFVTGRRVSFFVISIAVVAMITISSINIMDLRAIAKDAEKDYILKQEEKDRLESEYAMINDKEYIEAQARDRLRMIKPGEILYIFSENELESEKKK